MRRSPRRFPMEEDKTEESLPKGKYIFPDDISRLIDSYEPEYRLLPWVEQKMSIKSLLNNPNYGITKIFQNTVPPKYWVYLLANKNPDVVTWYLNTLKPSDFTEKMKAYLDATPTGRNYKRKYYEELGQPEFLEPSLGELLLSTDVQEFKKGIKHLDEIRTDDDLKFELSSNPLDEAVDFLNKNPDLISWEGFSTNPHPKVVNYLLKHPEKIKHDFVIQNMSPAFAPYMRKRIASGEIKGDDWLWLAHNPHIIDILEKNRNKLDYKELAFNPAIIQTIQGKAFPVLQKLRRSQ